MTNFTAHSPETAQGEAKVLLSKIQKKYGFTPNLFAYMAEAPTTLKAYLQLNDLLAEASLPMAQVQIALLMASLENDCGFCSVAHRGIGKQLGANPDSLNALNEGTDIADDKDRAVANFTRSVVRNRGWVPSEDVDAFIAAGFNQQQILEVILAVTIKTLSNYINHFTKPEPNKELLAML